MKITPNVRVYRHVKIMLLSFDLDNTEGVSIVTRQADTQYFKRKKGMFRRF